MELKNLYTIKKILETGSFQNAANALNYAQSTITFQVKQLENELGVKLFEKKGMKMELTEGGRQILPFIDQVLDAAEQLLACAAPPDAIRGTLKIALPETILTYQLQPVLQRFKQLAPHVNLSIRVMNCFAIRKQMLEGNFDIAIHYDVGKYPKSMVVKPIETFPLILVGSPALSQEARDFITPHQQKSICHIQNDADALYLKFFHQYLRRKHISLNTEMELWSIESVKRSVMSNLGVAYMPRFTVEEELAAGDLMELPTDMKKSTFTAIYVYRENQPKSPALQVFLRVLEDIFGHERPERP